MLSEIITAALAEAPGIVVTGSVGWDALNIHLENTDAVILEVSDPGASENFAPFLRSFQALKVVVIDNTSNAAYVHKLYARSIRPAELSSETLHSALRGDSHSG